MEPGARRILYRETMGDEDYLKLSDCSHTFREIFTSAREVRKKGRMGSFPTGSNIPEITHLLSIRHVDLRSARRDDVNPRPIS